MLDLWRSCRWSYGDRKLWDIDTWEYLIHIWSFVQHRTPTESAWHDWWYRGCFDAGGRPHATSFPQVIAMAASFNRCGRPRCCWKKAFKALIKTLLILASHLEILTRLWGWTHPLELPKWNVKKPCSWWTSGRLVTVGHCCKHPGARSLFRLVGEAVGREARYMQDVGIMWGDYLGLGLEMTLQQMPVKQFPKIVLKIAESI